MFTDGANKVIEDIFEAFGFGVGAFLIYLHAFVIATNGIASTGTLISGTEILVDLLEPFADFTVVVSTIFIFAAFLVGRIIIVLGQALYHVLKFKLLDRRDCRKSITLNGPYSDQQWSEITYMRNELCLFEGLHGLAFFAIAIYFWPSVFLDLGFQTPLFFAILVFGAANTLCSIKNREIDDFCNGSKIVTS